MKKWIGWILLALVLIVGFTPYALKTDNFGWEVSDLSTKTNRGETTTAYTTPAVTERDYANLIANHADAVIFTLNPYRYNTIGCRFIVDDEDDDTVFDVFATKKKTDHFTRIATLTIKGGTVSGPDTSTNAGASVFCDTITVTNEFWITSLKVVDGGATDRMSTIWWDMHGYDTWAFIGTTVDDTTLVQITGH